MLEQLRSARGMETSKESSRALYTLAFILLPTILFRNRYFRCVAGSRDKLSHCFVAAVQSYERGGAPRRYRQEGRKSAFVPILLYNAIFYTAGTPQLNGTG